MAKILVATIGAGQLDHSNKNARVYKTALYQIDGQEYETSFMAAALEEHLDLDSLILIGTVRSMWEEVYRYFCELKSHPFNSDYYEELRTTIEQQNHDSPLDALNLEPLEAALGPGSRCILIHYGLDQEELWRNFDRIMTISDIVQTDDALYLDITHAFRSLALFQFLVLTFMNELSTKDIQVAGIYYGMLDVMRELNYAPVIDLKPFFEMTTWISGIHSLQRYGNGYAIARLLRDAQQEALADEIERLSDVINLNLIGELKPQIKRLRKQIRVNNDHGPLKYVKILLADFLRRFYKKEQSTTEFQMEVSGWHFQNKRYASGYITLQETIQSHVCEQLGLDPTRYEDREHAKSIIHAQPNEPLSKMWFAINPIRNDIAHVTENRLKKQAWLEQQEAIFKLSTFEKYLYKFPKSQPILSRIAFVSEDDGKIHIPLKKIKSRHKQVMGKEAYDTLLKFVDTLADDVKMGPVYQRRLRRLLNMI